MSASEPDQDTVWVLQIRLSVLGQEKVVLKRFQRGAELFCVSTEEAFGLCLVYKWITPTSPSMLTKAITYLFTLLYDLQ